jgi:8-oxo-dGTP pyrophosphatase MutT (NUDIX family)
MRLVYCGEEPPTSFSGSIFLVGSPPTGLVSSWHSEALAHLAALSFEGVVFVPEFRDGQARPAGNAVAEWERRSLERADVIVFWAPEELAGWRNDVSALVEFGFWLESGKSILGVDVAVPSDGLLGIYATHANVPVARSLRGALELAATRIGPGAIRTDGERDVPLHIWRLPLFQNWYRSQREAGNRLHAARVVWTFRIGSDLDIFVWALHVDIYVSAEDRHKTNEVVIGRPDIATVVLFRAAQSLLDSEIVLVREFRSPARTRDGCVWELPGGSYSQGEFEARVVAVRECAEETGLRLEAERLKMHAPRQLASTLSAHQAHLFSVSLRSDEMDRLRTVFGEPQGVVDDTERTYVHIRTLRQILAEPLVDWSMMGMIFSALHSAVDSVT